ncbi:GNAT family N-acetyltransferase [Advenella sp. RU8]|uniref:GNAT family N-acetyltransferase n=1 Tax=Advenella sp. RU8 TaxID=3399575 RepID=UPI003AAC86A7
MSSYSLRKLLPSDIDAIVSIQRQAYLAELCERKEVLESKVKAAIAPETSWGVFRGAELCGYAIAYPWSDGLTPVWDHPYAAFQGPCNSIYIHDIAVATPHLRCGLAEKMLLCLFDRAALLGLNKALLIAVQGAHQYWQRFGFEVCQQLSTKSFGDDALCMQRNLLTS